MRISIFVSNVSKFVFLILHTFVSQLLVDRSNDDLYEYSNCPIAYLEYSIRGNIVQCVSLSESGKSKVMKPGKLTQHISWYCCVHSSISPFPIRVVVVPEKKSLFILKAF